MSKPCEGCGSPLSGATKYHHVRNHDNIIYAKRMNRDFLVSTDNGIVKGYEGDYIVMSERTGKRSLMTSHEWNGTWIKCIKQ